MALAGEVRLAVAAIGSGPLRVAILGDATLDLVADAVTCALVAEGECPLVFTAPYGTSEQQVLDEQSDLHRFRPDVVVVCSDARALAVGGHHDAGHIAADIIGRWDRLLARGYRVVQHLLVPDSLSLRGLADRRDGRRPLVDAVNDRLVEAAAGKVALVELDRLACRKGLDAWAAPRFYLAGKLPFNPAFLPDYLTTFRGAWRSAAGRSKKLLVLDLDDTLWGGVVGDDGVEAIALGPDFGARGEAFQAWQAHLSELGRHGVLLAICSKNERDAAEAGLRHPQSRLLPEQFVDIDTGWADKAARIVAMAGRLNIGLDAIVFVDDNPAERDLVRNSLPDVAVIEIGDDPARYRERLDEGHWFDLERYTEEDFQRTAAYSLRRQADPTILQAGNLEEHLKGLAMVGGLEPMRETDIPRLAQLEVKTNQFNLTGRRYGEADLARFMDAPSRLVLAFRLRDRFGDHGLVGSVIAVREGDALRIDSWVMSCRIFSRTAEEFVLAGLIRHAGMLGAHRIVGEYRPTTRNAPFAGLYSRLGFITDGADGVWSLPLHGVVPPATAIAVGGD
jgi:FkbH-like protein